MIRHHYRRWLVFVAALALPLLFATAAQAISLIKVREVYAGPNNDSYVELQAYASFLFSGDTLPGKSLVLFDDEGSPTLRFTFNEGNNLGADDTSFLIGGTGVESTFGVKPDIIDPLMNIDPSGGAACWNVGDLPVDCVDWGAFTGQAALTTYAETTAGPPASPGGITPGKAIERSITANCPTWLEADDDTDDSAADFTEVTPNPEPAGYYDPAEVPCFSGPSGTAITEEPANPSDDSSPHFSYTAAGATTFQCKLDAAPRFTTCPNSGIDYPNLSEGSHTLLVRGLDSNGPDVIPAAYTWTVDTTPPVASFVTHPGTTSVGTKAHFSLSSGEKGTTFSCSLDSGPAASCQPNVTLQSLSNGPHTFRVTAVDLAGNVQSAPTSYTWTVDAALPVTTIDSKPDNPSTGSSASFTYHSTRPDSVYECSMDGAPFSSCPSGGASYEGLAIGSHNFAVRSIDSDGDAEASPATYSFTIAATTTPPPLTCKKGFKKKTVHGKTRCVKVKVRHHKRPQ